ncbi:MAG: hypothetical protein ACYDBH_01665 [Acidobacteriaceae bacterium]
MYRQGDVLLIPVASMPLNAVPEKNKARGVVLALGESSGHAHVLDPVDCETLTWTDAGEIVRRGLRVIRETSLRHTNPDGSLTQEHGTITVPAGNYHVIIQREALADDEVRAVED